MGELLLLLLLLAQHTQEEHKMATIIFDPTNFNVQRIDLSEVQPTGEGTAVDPNVIEWPASPRIGLILRWRNALVWEDDRTLPELKVAKWTDLKQARSQAEYAGFTWDGSTFDSNALSQQRITGAVTLAQMDAAFSIGWTLADNTVRQLNAAQMKAVGTALGVHVATQFAHAQDLRTQLDAAQTTEQVAAVSW
jgi:hypothetical protein